jgi:putative sigma-54 modulation protein
VVGKRTVERRPMSIEEAVLQMDMLGHFFLFLDGDSGPRSGLCLRVDGDLGLMEPE